MAVPKKRQSPSRRNMRRAQHNRVPVPAVVICSNCSEPKLSHRICPACGHYAGKKVLEVAEE